VSNSSSGACVLGIALSYNVIQYVCRLRFEDPAAGNVKTTDFSDVTPRGFFCRYQRFTHIPEERGNRFLESLASTELHDVTSQKVLIFTKLHGVVNYVGRIL